MKPFDYSQWNLPSENKGLLFFVQAIEEQLFHYAHDSLKVPALNFHFLCFEIRNTIQKVRNGIVDKGSILPLFEELQSTFSCDPIVRSMFGDDFKQLFFYKNKKGDLERNKLDIENFLKSENSLHRLWDVTAWLITEMRIDRKYFVVLKTSIINAIAEYSSEIGTQNSLYQLSRILLADLINRGYSQEYIYLVINDIFYKRKQINNVDVALDEFWTSFDFKDKSYIVILPLNSSILKKHLQYFRDIKIEQNRKCLFKNRCKWIIKMTVKAMDPQTAHRKAIKLVKLFVSLLQYNNHQSHSYNENNAVVIQSRTNKRYNLKMPTTLLKRGRVVTDEESNERMAQMASNFSVSPAKLANVLELHSAAINANEVDNQLINLWTIVEVLVPIEPKDNYNKINQICNILISVLNAQYISSLVRQLYEDLLHCAPSTIIDVFSSIDIGENEVEKMASILVLEKFKTERDTLSKELVNYPLLQYRLAHYSNVFSDRLKIKEFLDSHKKRVSWHIMRIYRNRNMFVHDGTHFPYIDILVQNLHHYVDALIDTINLYAEKGYGSISSIYTALQQKECKYTLMLEERYLDKKPKPVDDNNFPNIVLGYLHHEF